MSRNEHFSEDAAAISGKLEKPVVIIGMMGSGKTRVGRKLAACLKTDFYDTDHLVEEKAGRTVAEIFKADGEPKFREAEKKTIMELLGKGPCVISSGGGTIMNEGVADALKVRAVTVWLRADPAEILARVKESGTRPLLAGGDPEKTLRELIEKRQPFYGRADVTVDTVQGSLDLTVGAVIKGLRDFLKADTF